MAAIRSTQPFGDLQIRAFRGLRDLTLERCGAVNLLVGANNSGKTSLLEALLLLANPLDIAQWEAAVALRRTWPLADVRFRGAERLDSLMWLFPRNGREVAPIEIGGENPTVHLSASAERIVGVPPPKPIYTANGMVEGSVVAPSAEEGNSDDTPQNGLTIDLHHTQRDAPRQVEFFNGEETSFRMVLWEYGRGRSVIRRTSENIRQTLPIAFATPISHRSDGYLAERVSKAMRTKRKRRILELLRTLDHDIIDLIILTPEESEANSPLPLRGRLASLHVEHAKAGLVPIHAMGDGTRRAIHFAALLANIDRGGVLLIDELEVGMHSSVLRDVFSWLGAACQEAGVQLFATTHSLEAIDAVLEAVPDENLVLYRLKKGQARRYGGELLRTARVELGQEVR